MPYSLAYKIVILACLGLLTTTSFIPISVTRTTGPLMVSYNPTPANNLHSPLSSIALLALLNTTHNPQTLTSANPRINEQSNLQSIRQSALRFITDNSYFPQSETTIAVDPNNPNHVVGGFNDDKYFFCPLLPADCGNSAPASISGFTTSSDGGKTVAKSSDIPDIGPPYLTSWGDPSVAATVDGNFFYASLAINPFSPTFGNGVMIAKSNDNLFNATVSCTTTVANPLSNPCWKAVFVYGGTFTLSFEDKDRIAVDRDPSSPYYGSAYISWDHFFPDGTSSSYLARCDGNLVSCTMLSGGDPQVISGIDPFVAWTTPTVDKNGNVYVAWCNFGTFSTFGPVTCKIAASPPGGNSFGSPNTILTYMGSGTMLPSDTVVIGWATEQFRVADGLISIAADLSSKSDNLYFTTSACVSGHYYQFSPTVIFVADDNPGNCGQSAVLFSMSQNHGSSWSFPTTLSDPAVNDQPFVTVDTQTGTICVAYYTTQYDPFNHRIDVVASISNNVGETFHQQRITTVSNEPNSDPNMYNYLIGGGFGSSFTVPQYGDYFEATAIGGTLWVLFTANYAVESGIFQTDPFLATVHNG